MENKHKIIIDEYSKLLLEIDVAELRMELIDYFTCFVVSRSAFGIPDLKERSERFSAFINVLNWVQVVKAEPGDSVRVTLNNK